MYKPKANHSNERILMAPYIHYNTYLQPLDDYLVTISNSDNVVLRNLTMENEKGAGVKIESMFPVITIAVCISLTIVAVLFTPFLQTYGTAL